MTEIIEGKEYTQKGRDSHWTVAKIHNEIVVIWWISAGVLYSNTHNLGSAKKDWIEYKEPVVLKRYIPVIINTSGIVQISSNTYREKKYSLPCNEVIDWLEVKYTVKE